MSHNPERKIKVCLNCGSDLHGRYCHVCGQENIEPKESFVGLVSHFFNDITHFDGSFFRSLKFLVLKPGFLSAEWTRGRRASYLHPVRMYIFTSAVFFLIFFSVYHFDESGEVSSGKAKKEARQKISEEDRKALNSVFHGIDSNLANRRKDTPDIDSTDPDSGFTGFDSKVEISKEAYDSAQALLPASRRDGWFVRQLQYKMMKEKQSGDYKEQLFFSRLFNKFFHLLPQLLFVTLPLYALILKLLYIRRRKDFYYSDHAIYSIHIFIFTFIAFLVSIGFSQLERVTHWRWLSFLSIIIMIYLIVYNLIALKRFYGQSKSKTLLKSLLLFFLAAFMVLTLFVIFLGLSFFQL